MFVLSVLTVYVEEERGRLAAGVLVRTIPKRGKEKSDLKNGVAG